MKIKTLLGTIIAIIAFTAFASCDDDLNSVGDDIQPKGDDVIMGIDTFAITAHTVDLGSIYARSTTWLLGKYEDPLLGPIKGSYLCEFAGTSNFSFDEATTAVDSVKLTIVAKSYVGDTTSTMGLGIYEINKTTLDKEFNSDVDVSKYCDLSKPLLKTAYTVSSGAVSSDGSRVFSFDLDKDYMGTRFWDEYKRDPSTFKNTDKLKKFFKGLYVDTNFGSGSLMNVAYTYMSIYYKYDGLASDGVTDSTYTARVQISTTTDVIQINKIENTYPSSILSETEKSYIKAPAGVYTEIEIPIGKIMKKQEEKQYKVLNDFIFKLKGRSEEEAKLGIGRPSALLLINSDSIPNFFKANGAFTDKNRLTTTIILRTASTNSYDFGNLSLLLDHYIKQYRDENTTIDESLTLKYSLIPVDYTIETISSGYSSYTQYKTATHQVTPSGAILRTDEDNMKVKIVQSNYRSNIK